MKTRKEKDSLGTLDVPEAAYYGVETVRAMLNFPISGYRFHRDFIWALGHIKKACARANESLGNLDKARARAIIRACDEVIAGDLDSHYVTDVLQAGAGVSAHMNINEIIANRALEILGRARGDYAYLHSHDHVNMGQSTNDVIPTAMRLSALKIQKRFDDEAAKLEKSFAKKAKEFARVIKAGRTHMQDAAPISLGQEFSGWAKQLEKGRKRVADLTRNLHELGIGGSAVGTGLNTTLAYRKKVIAGLKTQTGIPVKSAANLFEVMQSDADFAGVSGGLRNYALAVIQIATDLRLISSGPNTGFQEIELPPRQPGSSIMPGKINPVMAEAAQQTAYQVIGHDAAIASAVTGGQLELNVMRPVIAHNLLQAFECLSNMCRLFKSYCIDDIKANRENCRRFAEKSYGIAAALNPYIGYSKGAECVKKSAATGKTLRQVVVEENLLSEKELDRILSPENLTRPKK